MLACLRHRSKKGAWVLKIGEQQTKNHCGDMGGNGHKKDAEAFRTIYKKKIADEHIHI